MRMNRWSKSGVLDRVFEQSFKLEAVSLDSTIARCIPIGGAKKNGPQLPEAALDMVARMPRTAVTLRLHR